WEGGGALGGDRAQLERRGQLGPHIRVEGGGRLIFQRLIDRPALLIGQRLEGVGNDDELVVGRILRGEFRGHGVSIRRRARNRQGAVDEYGVRLLLRVGRWRLLLSGGNADAGHKRQRERAGAQKGISHGGLLFARSERTLSHFQQGVR